MFALAIVLAVVLGAAVGAGLAWLAWWMDEGRYN